MPKYSFVSLPKSTIEDFENGQIDKKELFGKFGSANSIVSGELFEVIKCTLELFAPENPAVAFICEERHILADPTGEALLFEDYAPDDDYENEVCEPVGYKTTDELQVAVQFLQSFEDKDFRKTFSIRSVLQETSFALYDTQSVLDQQDKICESAYQELQKLGNFYKQSLAEENYVVMTMIWDEIE